MKFMARIIVLALGCAVAAGCAEGVGDPAVGHPADHQTEPGPTSSDMVPPDTEPDSPACVQTIPSFGAFSQEAYYYDDGTDRVWIYLAPDADPEGGTFDVVGIEIWPSLGGPSTPGTYPFSDENYSTCSLCGLYQSGCVYDGTTTTCGKTYLITGGTLTLSQLGIVGGTFAGSASSLTGTEVTIDPDTYVSTPVTGSGKLCINSAALSASVYDYPTE
jgi:hypothetical protein